MFRISLYDIDEEGNTKVQRKHEGTCYRAHFTQLAASSRAGVDTAQCLFTEEKKSARTRNEWGRGSLNEGTEKKV